MLRTIRKSIKKSIVVGGRGLHTGAPSTVTLSPAGEGVPTLPGQSRGKWSGFPGRGGVFFLRKDISGSRPVPALFPFVGETERGVTLRAGAGSAASVRTVEHLLAAAYGLGITDLLVEIEGEETPLLDGSALPWVEALREAGIVEAGGNPGPVVHLQEKLVVEENGGKMEVFPFDGLKVRYQIEFPPPVGRQEEEFLLDEAGFSSAIAPARTFGFVEWAKELEERGLARGVIHSQEPQESCLLASEGRYLNSPRFENEAVRHKILDFLGDLSLFPGQIRGEFRLYRGSHALHLAGVRLLARAYLGPQVAEESDQTVAGCAGGRSPRRCDQTIGEAQGPPEGRAYAGR